MRRDKIADVLVGPMNKRIINKKNPREETLTYCFLSLPDKEKFLSINKTFDRVYNNCYEYELALLRRPVFTSEIKRARKWGDRLMLDDVSRLRLLDFLRNPTSASLSIKCPDGCSIIEVSYLADDDEFEFSQYTMSFNSNSRIFANFVELKRNQITMMINVLKD